MRALPFVILAVLTLVLQVAVAPAIRLTSAEFQPQLPLILAMFVALYARNEAAVLACWALGLLLDLASTGPIGGFAFAFGLVGLGIVAMRPSLFRDHPVSHFFLAAVFGFLANAIVVLMMLLRQWVSGDGQAGSVWHILVIQPLGAAIYTALLAPYAMLLLNRLRRLMAFPERT